MATDGADGQGGQATGAGNGHPASRGWRKRFATAPKRFIAFVIGIPAFAAGAAYLLPIVPAIVMVYVTCDDSNIVVTVRNFGGRTAELGQPRFQLLSPERHPSNHPELFHPFYLTDLQNPMTESNRRIVHFSSQSFPYPSPDPLFDLEELRVGATVRVTIAVEQWLYAKTERSGEARCEHRS